LTRVDLKGSIKSIIERMTQNSPSVFLEQLYLEAGEHGIGENYVNQAVQELIAENFVEEAFNNRVLKRLS